jgi:hypothetical protein
MKPRTSWMNINKNVSMAPALKDMSTAMKMVDSAQKNLNAAQAIKDYIGAMAGSNTPIIS